MLRRKQTSLIDRPGAAKMDVADGGSYGACRAVLQIACGLTAHGPVLSLLMLIIKTLSAWPIRET